MISDKQLLYKRHLLSIYQIEAHFGKGEGKTTYYTNEILQTAQSFFEVVDELQRNEIEFIPLKGAVLSFHIYRDLLARRYYDIDILIDFASIEETINVLTGIGYQLVSHWPSTKKEKLKLERKSNQILLQHRTTKKDLEIHWRLFSHVSFADYGFKRLYDEFSCQFSIEDRHFKKLSNEIELLFLIIHGTKHSWSKIKWLIDVSDYLHNIPVDQEIFLDMAYHSGFVKALVCYNILSKRYIPSPSTIVVNQNSRIPFVIINSITKQIEEKLNRDPRVYQKRTLRALSELHLIRLYFTPGKVNKLKVLKVFMISILSRLVTHLPNGVQIIIKRAYHFLR